MWNPHGLHVRLEIERLTGWNPLTLSLQLEQHRGYLLLHPHPWLSLALAWVRYLGQCLLARWLVQEQVRLLRCPPRALEGFRPKCTPSSATAHRSQMPAWATSPLALPVVMRVIRHTGNVRSARETIASHAEKVSCALVETFDGPSLDTGSPPPPRWWSQVHVQLQLKIDAWGGTSLLQRQHAALGMKVGDVALAPRGTTPRTLGSARNALQIREVWS